ncbi:hypothetical protein NQ318_007782 [Aromia moschata]|uniref:Transposase n=1 Tax=Aromia moschata TaxID=1265417 RepID=A0AAV8Z1L9_9CUCU|nr:hypothetical protein NQ318_007782 [Aromia moschata]
MHRSGKTHGNADTLSRRPCLKQKCRYCQKIETKEYSNETCNELLMATTIQVEDEWSSEKLKKSQKKLNLKLIRNWVKNGVRPTWQEVSRYVTTIKGYWAQWNSLCLRDGLLHRKWESPDGVSAVYQLVLPKARIQELEELHSNPSGGHFRVTRTLTPKKPKSESLPEFVEDLRERMDRIHRFAREKLKIHSDKMKQRLAITSTETAFKPDDAVWLYAPKKDEKKKSKTSEQLGRPVHHNKENQRPGLPHPALQEASRRWSIWKGSRSIQDIMHPIGLSSRIHRLGLKTVTNNLKEGSSVTFVKVTLATADIY